jgi:hypothetical protein
MIVLKLRRSDGSLLLSSLFLALTVGLFLPTVLRAQTFSVANTPLVPKQRKDHPEVLFLEVFLKGEGLSEPLKKESLTVTDLNKASPVSFIREGEPKYEGGTAQRSYWRTTWRVANLTPGIPESRSLLLQLGQKTIEIVPLTFSYRPPVDLQVSVTGPGAPLRLRYSRSGELRIAVHGHLSGVSLSQAPLVDDKTSRPLPLNQLELSATSDGPASPSIGLTLDKPVQPIYLRVKDTFKQAGKFTGNVSLGSNEKPDLGSFSVTVYSTSPAAQGWGVGFIAVGLSVYFAVTIWSKARSRRILALLPAARLREEVARLIFLTEEVHNQTHHNFAVLLGPAGTPGSLRDLFQQLSEQNLDNRGFLPPTFVSPFGNLDLSMPYQSFLLQVGNQVSALGMIVRWGLASVLVLWPDVLRWHREVDGNAALDTLDLLGRFAGPPDLLRTQIQTAITTVQNAINAAATAAGGAPAAPSPGVQGIPVSQQLTIQLERLSMFVWVLWAVLTIAVGACTLVWFNDGFGTTQDAIQCFLWGAGVPAVAQGFGALTSGAVTSAFAIQVPR